MTISISSVTSLASRFLPRCAVICALALTCTALRSAEPNQVNEKISEELQKIKPLTETKNWEGALVLINSLKPLAQPDSYDIAILSNIEYTLLLQKGDYAKAIAPLELALRLGRSQAFFENQTMQEMVLYLAQIYYQEGTTTKSLPLQQQYFSKAATYIKAWLDKTELPATDTSRQESTLIYATILYNEAVLNPAKIDLGLIRQSEKVLQDALLSIVRPKESVYVMLLLACQQEGDYVRAAEILELLVKTYPSKKDYWSQLLGAYQNLSQDKDEDKAREYYIRSILTLERAQACGFLKTQKENYNLVGTYFNVGQFGKATALLHRGLKDGSIESAQKNWELLAYSYQQVNEPLQAIQTLKEAAQQFSRAGQIDYQISQIYYGLDKSAECYESLKSAVAKGNLEKPGAVYSFLSYVCYDLRKYEEAIVNIDLAIKSNEAKPDPQLPRLKEAIQDAITERNAKAEAKTK